MPISRANPVGWESVGSLDPERFKDAIKKVVVQINDADDANRGWLSKQAALTKLRFGFRKARNIPWRGASNITVPIIDKSIRRWRPPIASLILDAEPIAIFTPQEVGDFDASRSVEPFFTWMFREQMRTKRELIRLVDTLGARGHAYAREGWFYRTQRKSRIVPAKQVFPEGIDMAVAAAQQADSQVSPLILAMQRIAQMYNMPIDMPAARREVFQAASRILQGADFASLVTSDLVDDRPDWKAIDPINVIVPVDQNPQEADFFCMVYRMGRQEISRRARDGFFRGDTASELLKQLERGNLERPENTPADDVREVIRRIRDKQAQIDSETGKNTKEGDTTIWEVFCHIDINQDGLDERVVLWYAPATKTVLQLFEYPFPFDKWPITPFEFNADSDRIIDNRGIPEMILSFQKLASAMYNARIDASTIVLSPAMKMRTTGGNYKKAVNYRPGAIIPVTNPDDLTPIVHDLRILSALLQEQQVGQAVAEDYIGTFDATIGRLQDQNAPERRTATEVSAIQNVAASVFGLDAKMFTEQMSESFTKIWNLYEEWGEEELFFRVQGEALPRSVLKNEITKNYDIRAAGTPANTQKQLMLAHYREVLQLALQDKSGLLNLPLLLQSYLKIIDPIVAAQAIRPLEESRQVSAIQQAAQIAAPDQEFGGL